MTATEGFMKAQIEQLKEENWTLKNTIAKLSEECRNAELENESLKEDLDKTRKIIAYIMERENIMYIEQDGYAYQIKED